MRKNVALDSGSDTSSTDMNFHENPISKTSEQQCTANSTLDVDILNSPIQMNPSGPPAPPATNNLDFLSSPTSPNSPGVTNSTGFGEYPESPAGIPELPDFMSQQFRDWAFDSMPMPDFSTPMLSPDTAFSPSIFDSKEVQLSNFQPQYEFSMSEQVFKSPQRFKQNSVYSSSPTPESGFSEFEGGEFSDAPMTSIESDSYFDQQPVKPVNERKSSPCSTCSSNGPKAKPSSAGCTCNANIISHISYMPEEPTHHRSYEMDLAQIQEALKLGSEVLNCACSGKDYAVGLSMSLLAARIVSVLEQLCRKAKEEQEEEAIAFSKENDLGNSPQFALGMYKIAKEDERRLKQDMLGLQIKKAELLIVCSKDIVARFAQKHPYQMDAQAVVTEKIFLLLAERVAEMRKEWSGA
ncbi:hypothetical protein G7Y89_g966 [Cudoniella acicularis]|uniref:Uncharacterized protein n=1 Tax=Cudoniella acicularis TaxID=354080 RepID=A0A8H4RX77_9HELO|nr:hypothetical protein G7Y89_g966 [Cudoniella acicularis]